MGATGWLHDGEGFWLSPPTGYGSDPNQSVPGDRDRSMMIWLGKGVRWGFPQTRLHGCDAASFFLLLMALLGHFILFHDGLWGFVLLLGLGVYYAL